MPSETVLTKGLVERIGLEDSIFTITVDGEKQKEITNIPDHAVAVNMLLKKLTENGIVKSLDEIGGIGHRVVHGGEKFADSVLITDEVLADIEELSDLAPLHNPANVVGIKAFQEVLPNVPAVAVSIQHSTKQCRNLHSYTAYRMSTTKSSVSVSTVSTELLINM